MKHDLFISYADADRPFVHGYLAGALGLSPERLVLSGRLRPGSPVLQELERAVRDSRYILLVLSPAYLADTWGSFSESIASFASVGEARLIPLILKACEVPLRVRLRASLDFTDEARWEEESRRLREVLTNADAPSEEIECPYPGMRPFTEENTRHFHGREGEIQEVLRGLRNHRELFVIGPSGSGKSSLIAAGVLPRLGKSGLFKPDAFLVRTLRLGDTPMEALGEALGGDAGQPVQAMEGLLGAGQRLLLFIDQFEEVFTLPEREARLGFFTALQALREAEACTLVVAMRADFYQELMNSSLWPPAHRLDVTPLRADGLIRAIRQPAQEVGVYMEEALCERLRQDSADEPGVLPLLQETLALLWERRSRRLLRLSDYEALGGAGRTGLAVALAEHADATLAMLRRSPIGAAREAIARRVLLRLVSFGEGRRDTRRQQPLDALRSAADAGEDFDETIRVLTDGRLLTLGGAEGAKERRVDISHEALLEGWPQLARWLGAKRQAEQVRRRLEDKAREWVRLGRGEGGLLDAAELPEAEGWVNGSDAVDLGSSTELRDLIATSRRVLTEEEAAKEAARKRELVQAQALAEEQRRRADEAAQAARAQRRLLAGVALLAVGAVLGGAVALWQRTKFQQALLDTSVERGRQLLLEGQPERALLWLHRAYQGGSQSSVLKYLLGDAVGPASRWVSLEGHQASVVAAAFSPDGARIVTASEDKTAKVWDARTGKVLFSLDGHQNLVNAAAFSPDGTCVATASFDRTAKVWDARTGKLLSSLDGHQEVVWAAVFSPDGTRIVTASRDKTAKVWDARTGKLLCSLDGHQDPVFAAAFSRDGSRIVTASVDKTAKVWDARTGKLLCSLDGHQDRLSAAAFSADGSRIVTASTDKTAKVWDAGTGKLLSSLNGHWQTVFAAAFSPDGARVVTASDDTTAKVWDVRTGTLLSSLVGHREGVLVAEFSPDGARVVTASDDNTAKLWDVRTGKVLSSLDGHRERVVAAEFSPDGARVVTASDDKTAKVWDARMGKLLSSLDGHHESVTAAAFSPDGACMVTASHDGTAKLWDMRTGKLRSSLDGHQNGVRAAEFSPDGARVVTASDDKTAKVWDARTGKLLSSLDGHQNAVFAAEFSPDGARVVTASDDKTAKVWDARTGKLLSSLDGHQNGVRAAAFSPDGARVVTASNDKTAKMWDAGTGKLLSSLIGHQNAVFAAEFSPDGARIVTASHDGTAKLWDGRTGKLLSSLVGHQDDMRDAAFSPDGTRIVTASGDRTAKVWDAKTGKPLSSLDGHQDPVFAAAFSPDGARVVTASYDRTAKVWDAKTGKPLSSLDGHQGGVTAAAFSPDGARVVTASYDKTEKLWDVQPECRSAAAIERLIRCHLPFRLEGDVVVPAKTDPSACDEPEQPARCPEP